jgi:hypothetical protein
MGSSNRLGGPQRVESKGLPIDVVSPGVADEGNTRQAGRVVLNTRSSIKINIFIICTYLL